MDYPHIAVTALYCIWLIFAIIGNNSARYRLIPLIKRPDMFPNVLAFIRNAILVYIFVNPIKLESQLKNSIQYYIDFAIQQVYHPLMTAVPAAYCFATSYHQDITRLKQQQLYPELLTQKYSTQFTMALNDLVWLFFLPVAASLILSIYCQFCALDNTLPLASFINTPIFWIRPCDKFAFNIVSQLPVCVMYIVFCAKSIYNNTHALGLNRAFSQKMNKRLAAFVIVEALFVALAVAEYFVDVDMAGKAVLKQYWAYMIVAAVQEGALMVWYYVYQVVRMWRIRARAKSE